MDHSFSVYPKAVIHADENGKKKIKEWKVSLSKRDLPFEVSCETNVYTDLVNHESLFGLTKELNVDIPAEYYHYHVENLDKTIVITSRSLEVLKHAIGSILKDYHDNRVIIKRQWELTFKEKEDEEEKDEDEEEELGPGVIWPIEPEDDY